MLWKSAQCCKGGRGAQCWKYFERPETNFCVLDYDSDFTYQDYRKRRDCEGNAASRDLHNRFGCSDTSVRNKLDSPTVCLSVLNRARFYILNNGALVFQHAFQWMLAIATVIAIVFLHKGSYNAAQNKSSRAVQIQCTRTDSVAKAVQTGVHLSVTFSTLRLLRKIETSGASTRKLHATVCDAREQLSCKFATLWVLHLLVYCSET